MDNLENIVTNIILDASKRKFAKIPNKDLALSCQSYAEQIAPEVVSQLFDGKSDVVVLKDITTKQAKKELTRIVTKFGTSVMLRVNNNLPDGAMKNILNDEISETIQTGWGCYMDGGDWKKAVTDRAKTCAMGYAKQTSHKAFNAAKKYFPENRYYMAFCDDVDNIATGIVAAVENGETIEDICTSVKQEVKSKLIHHGTDYVQKKIDGGVDTVINCIADSMKRNGRGKKHSSFNEKVDSATDAIKESLKNNSKVAVNRLIEGDDVNAVAGSFAKETVKNVVQKSLDKYADEYISDSVNSAVKRLHVTGKGSKKINRCINDVGDAVTERLTANVSANVMDVLYGNKNLEVAVKDIAVDTAKQSAKKYIKENGKKLIEETLGTIENATLSIGVETVRNLYLVSKGQMVAKEAARHLAKTTEIVANNKILRNGMKDMTKATATNMKKSVAAKATKSSALTTICTTIIVATVDCLFSDKKVSFEKVFDSLIDSTVGSFEGILQMAATYAGVPGVGEVIGLSVMISSLCSYVHCMGEYGNAEINHRLEEMETVKNVAIQELTRQRKILKKLLDENELKWNKALENFETFVIKGAIENNSDLVAKGIDGVLKIFGKNVRYSTKEEFEDDFWDSEKAFEF